LTIVLLEKLINNQLVKEFHAYHGTWRFIAVLTDLHKILPDFMEPKDTFLSLSWARWIQSIPVSLRAILILSSYLCPGLTNGSFLWYFWQIFFMNFQCLPGTRHACPANPCSLDHPNIMKLRQWNSFKTTPLKMFSCIRHQNYFVPKCPLMINVNFTLLICFLFKRISRLRSKKIIYTAPFNTFSASKSNNLRGLSCDFRFI
jgi:hypothetical protein